MRGTAPGPVFTGLRPGLQSLQPISGTATISKIVKDRAAAAGLSAEQITTHSLRVDDDPPREHIYKASSRPRPASVQSWKKSFTDSDICIRKRSVGGA